MSLYTTKAYRQQPVYQSDWQPLARVLLRSSDKKLYEINQQVLVASR
jgi:hypothetical protein